MRDLGLLQFRNADTLREQDRAREVQDEEARRRELVESSLSAQIRRAWEANKSAKIDVERRMLSSLRRRKGEYDPDKLHAIKKEGGAEIFMMLTATKCRAAAAWIRDILMPANERPWGLDPTPVAEVPDSYLAPMMGQIQQQMMAMAQQGQQVDQQKMMEKAREQIRQMAQERAEEAAERHEQVIADQFAEGGWDDALEAFIDDFVTYPAAFMRAPILRRVTTLGWQEGWIPVKQQEIRPEYVRVSPFDIYPSADSTSTDDGTNLIERARFTRTNLVEMKGVPGFSDEAIDAALQEYGQGGLRDWLWHENERRELEGRGHDWLSPSETIDGLIYWGSAQGITLLQWGMSPDEIPNPLGEYQVEAILIGRHVIRVRIDSNPLERRPYHKASFQPIPGSFWGISIPELMGDIQDVCNATARSLVNNLAISSGPQVEVYEDRLNPEEDPTDIYPWKVWRTKDSNLTSNNPAVRFYQPSANANELLAVYEQFERRADDATNIPRYAYGNDQAQGAGQTASGLSMLMESANKGIKDAIRHIDRGVIRRVVEATWLHNMLHSNDTSIKGDVSVVPRGSSAMLIREQTHNMRLQFLQMTANEFDMAILGQEGRRKLLDKVAGKLDMPNLMPSEEELQQRSQQQEQQAQQQQQVEMAKQQGELQAQQAKAQKDAADAQQTSSETQIAESMAPLDAKHLLAEIAKLIAETRGEVNRDRREGMEVVGDNQPYAGRGRPAFASQVPAGGGSQQSRVGLQLG